MYLYHHVLSFYTHLSSTYTIRYFIFLIYKLYNNFKESVVWFGCLYTKKDYFVCILPSLDAYQYPPHYFFAPHQKKNYQKTTRPTPSIKKILFGLKDTYVDIYIVCQKKAIYIKKKDRSKERERGRKICIQKTKTSERRWYD